DVALLDVQIAHAPRWHRPGLLLIGDAAHVISPVGGNGILMAVQDAVATANRLVPALRDHGAAAPEVLAAIQAEREPAIDVVQAQQTRIERRIARSRERGKPLTPPGFLRWITALPGVRARAAKANAYGPRPPRLDLALFTADRVDAG
ncbi:MAG: FAD-dependent monooxygenase, partial [Umezawaea sp.]